MSRSEVFKRCATPSLGVRRHSSPEKGFQEEHSAIYSSDNKLRKLSRKNQRRRYYFYRGRLGGKKYDLSMWIKSRRKKSDRKIVHPCEPSPAVKFKRIMICPCESSPAIEIPIKKWFVDVNQVQRQKFRSKRNLSMSIRSSGRNSKETWFVPVIQVQRWNFQLQNDLSMSIKSTGGHS